MNDLRSSIKINDLSNGKELIFKDYYYNNITERNISNIKKKVMEEVASPSIRRK